MFGQLTQIVLYDWKFFKHLWDKLVNQIFKNTFVNQTTCNEENNVKLFWQLKTKI